jgi:hypothetical protein
MRALPIEQRAQKIGITLAPAILEKVDNVRGDVPRSRFIARRLSESMLGEPHG